MSQEPGREEPSREEPSHEDPGQEAHAAGEGRTEEYETLAAGLAVDDLDDLPVDEEGDEWPTRGPARGIRLALPTAGLVAVVLVAAGFWGGAALQKSHGGSGSGGAGSALAARFRAAAAAASGTTGATGATGAAGAGRGFAGASAAATGTVSVVDGDTLYVVTSDGQLVKVTLGASATITRDAKAQAVDLRPGDTVVVQGSTAANGDVTATSVTAVASGVTAAGGRFGRGFGGGGGGFGGGTGSGSGG